MKASDTLVDRQATERTKNLYQNLKDIQKSGKVLFGHQEATSYGRTWVGDKNRSDVKDVTGSHPAVIGLDFANVTTSDSEPFEKAKHELITSVVDTYNRGGVSTFAWHASNPGNSPPHRTPVAHRFHALLYCIPAIFIDRHTVIFEPLLYQFTEIVKLVFIFFFVLLHFHA